MIPVDRHRTGEESPGLRSLTRPEWAPYWPLRALTREEEKQIALDVEMLDWAASRRGPGSRAEEYDERLAAAMARADEGGWRRHLLVALMQNGAAY